MIDGSIAIIRDSPNGEADYLGLLAYPGADETKQRSKFVRAIEAWHAAVQQGVLGHRDLPEDLRQPSRKLGILRKGYRRIRKNRVPAAWIAMNRFVSEDGANAPRRSSVNNAARDRP